jgi:hypothetical protein
MKTIILIAALMITFSTYMRAETKQVKSEDSLSTSALAEANGLVPSETTGMKFFVSHPSVIMPSAGTLENAVNLEEWIESRELWEQQNSEMISLNNSGMTVNLEEWIGSRETWEQECSETATFSATYHSSLLQEWVTECETWEQENSGAEWTAKSAVNIQQDWISKREAWEQK